MEYNYYMNYNDFDVVESAAFGALYGLLDDENYIVELSIPHKLIVYKYLRTLLKLGEKKDKYSLEASVEYTRESLVMMEIGVYLFDEIEKSLIKHDKKTLRALIEVMKEETQRVKQVTKVKNDIISTVTQGTVDQLLTHYNFNELSKDKIVATANKML